MDAVAVAAIVGGVVAPASLALAWLQFRHSARRDARIDQALEEFTKIVKSYDQEVGALRKEVEELKGAHSSPRAITTVKPSRDELRAQRLALEAQKEARREREASWKRLRELGRGAKWFFENG